MQMMPTAENARNVIIDRHGIELGKERTRFDWALLKRCYALGKPFWLSREGTMAWFILAFSIALTIGSSATLGIQLSMTRVMTNNLIAKHVSAFWHFFLLITLLQGVIGLLYTIQGPLVGLLQLWWRRALTRQVLADYLSHRAYYRINQTGSVDNPDQRISDDINYTVAQLFGIYSWVSTIISTLAVYLPYTWKYAGPRTFVALSIVGATSLIFPKIFAYFVPYQNAQLKAEADFRFALVRLRENSESVAFYQGEVPEHKALMGRFGKVFRVGTFLLVRTIWLNTTSQAYYTILGAMPTLLVYPIFFAGRVDYGTLVNINQVVGAELNYLAVGLLFFNEWLGVAVAVNRLWNLVQQTKREDVIHPASDAFFTEASDRIATKDLTFSTPDGSRLLAMDLTFNVRRGKSLLVVGPSGSGKSALLRTIAGLWAPASGQVFRPALSEIAFLPQRPYMPLGDLREQLVYPRGWREGETYPDDAKLIAALHDAGADYLIEQYGGLSAGADWEEVLSLGEQQMIAFARLFLTEASFALLDEATSALPEAAEQQLYEKLRKSGTTYISVGHRTSLYPYHVDQLIFKGSATWQLEPV